MTGRMPMLGSPASEHNKVVSETGIMFNAFPAVPDDLLFQVNFFTRCAFNLRSCDQIAKVCILNMKLQSLQLILGPLQVT